MEGIVIEIWPEKYEINLLNSEQNILAVIKGALKKKIKPLVGDNVILEKINDQFVIVKVKKRINEIIRPPVANVEQMFCVISNTTPKPDLLVLDKLIIMAKQNHIYPIICINKCDTALSDLSKYIIKTYTDIGYMVITSNTNNNIKSILKNTENKISILAGVSGVGKTSIIKAIFPEKVDLQIDKVNKKINRGKHTTKYVRLYKLGNGYIADTPGFSAFDMIYNLKKEDLKKYYVEYLNLNCKYQDCNHISEKEEECQVKFNLIEGKLDKGRYERYIKIYNELQKKEKYKYK